MDKIRHMNPNKINHLYTLFQGLPFFFAFAQAEQQPNNRLMWVVDIRWTIGQMHKK